jgi:hypothetical protein
MITRSSTGRILPSASVWSSQWAIFIALTSSMVDLSVFIVCTLPAVSTNRNGHRTTLYGMNSRTQPRGNLACLIVFVRLRPAQGVVRIATATFRCNLAQHSHYVIAAVRVASELSASR